LGLALAAALQEHQIFAFGRDEMDVTDAVAVERAMLRAKPDLVIHTAAWTDTQGCERDPERSHLVNVEGTSRVAMACAGSGTAMLHVSSNEVFDGEKDSPYAEDDEPNPLNVYARSKLASEKEVLALLERFYIVRTSWLYGAGRVSFPEKILENARTSGELRVVTDEVASPTWTDSLAQGITRLIQGGQWGIYHLTNSGFCSRFEWAAEVLRSAGMTGVEVSQTTQAEFGAAVRKPSFSALSNEKAVAMGIALPPWQEALAAYLGRKAKSLRAARR